MATPIITDGSLDRVRKTPRVVLPIRADIFAERAVRWDLDTNVNRGIAYQHYFGQKSGSAPKKA